MNWNIHGTWIQNFWENPGSTHREPNLGVAGASVAGPEIMEVSAGRKVPIWAKKNMEKDWGSMLDESLAAPGADDPDC